MSEIRKQIEAINKNAKKARTINNILWFFVAALVVLAFYLTYVAIDAKATAQENEQIAREAEAEAKEQKDIAEKAKQSLVDNINKSRNILWENAKSINTVDSYSYYISIYTNEDQNFPELEEKMDDLFRDKGYVQILDSDGRTRYFEEVSGLELGKYFKALTDRNVNTGVLGVDSGAGNKVGHSIRKDQIVRLEKEHKSGDAVWAEIGYTNQ